MEGHLAEIIRETRGIEGLSSPIIGRDQELLQLHEAFQALYQGDGGIIAVIGEAGIGKSRLVMEIRQLMKDDLNWVEGRALHNTQAMSYWVARDMLRGMLGVDINTPQNELAETLSKSVSQEWHPYLARLLDVSIEGRLKEKVEQLDPGTLQRRMLYSFTQFVRSRAHERPLVLEWEDLHWVDPSSLNLIEMLFPLIKETPLLMLLVFRPEKGGVWDFHVRTGRVYKERYSVIEMNPLSYDHSECLVRSLLKLENLPEKLNELIQVKAEGNPFFVEELLRSLIDSGVVVLNDNHTTVNPVINNISGITIPDTLQGVIASRIDHLSVESKQTLQTAAVIGRAFQKRVLKSVIERDVKNIQLDDSLSDL